jgi:glycosyltransferase involved in cell wall biosynthesis
MPRIALALLRGYRKDPAALVDRTGETQPRGFLFDELFSPGPVYDESTLDAVPPLIKRLNRRLPPGVQLALEVHRRSDEYDAIVTWGERLSMSLMALQALSPSRKPHIPMMYWFSKPNVQLPIRAFGKSLNSVVTWPSVQRRFLIERLGFPAEKVHFVKYSADTVFWRPLDLPIDGICSVGREMRDYATLIEALKGTDLKCHIAADHVRVNRRFFGHRRVAAAELAATAGPNVTVGAMPLPKLRELYARSAFLVMPLLPTDTDNGISVILEAMAAGKTVICSRTEGQVDVIQDGVTGLFVPQGDPVALRRAMVELWNDPARAKAMGEAARKYVVENHSLEKFCRDVKAAVESSI